MTPRRPRIAFLTARDPADRRTQSGVFHFMAQSLQKQCGDVEFLGPVSPTLPAWQAALTQRIDAFSRKRFQRRYDFDHSLFLAKAYARHFAKKLSRRRFDLIFAPNASTELALLRTPLPVVYVSDTTVKLMNGYYPSFSRLVNFWESHFIEWKAIRRASALVYRSSWAAASAVRDYGADPEKTFALPNGANLDPVPDAGRVLRRKKNPVCRLLFLGVEWDRKGGPIAHAIRHLLQSRGTAAELIVCGCVPPDSFSREGLTLVPFLDKNDAGQRRQLTDLLMAADFLLLPTRQDCFSNAICEASACGLPSISTDTGGVSAALSDGVNGRLLPVDAEAADYVRVIEEIFHNEPLYDHFARSSRKTHEDRLNWETWGTEIQKILLPLLAPQSGHPTPPFR